MKRLNQYLLIHLPALWATQFQYLFLCGLFCFIALTAIAYKMPIAYNSVSNPTYIVGFLSFLVTAFYIWWLARQRVLAYQVLLGITGKLFFLKAILTAYIGIVVSGAVFFLPFNILNKRLKIRHLDPALPALNLSGIQNQVSTSILLINSNNSEADKFNRRTIDALTDFSSTFRDSTHSFRQSFNQRLSNAKIVEMYLLNSGLGVDSITINQESKIIQAYYSPKTSPAFVEGMQIVNFDQYKENQLKTSLYGNQIFLRTYTAFSVDKKLTVPIQVYYYNSPYSGYLRYCDVKTIQASLLVDKMITQIGETSRKVTLERLDTMIDTVKQVGKINYIAYGMGMALFTCSIITLVAFVGNFTEFKNISVIFTTYFSLTMFLSLFVPKVGIYLSNHLLIAAAILFSSMIIVGLLSIRSYRTDLAVMVAISLMLIPSSVIILMLLHGSGNSTDSSLILNDTLIHRFSGDFGLSCITVFFLLIILPWFFATKFHRLSILPKK